MVINRALVVTLLLSTSLPAAETGPEHKSPKIACKQPVYEFGTVDNSKSVEHTFIIWNEGNAPLQIDRIRGCCGATTKIADKTIPPGTNTTFKVTLSLRGRKGKQRKNFYIMSNDPKQRYCRLSIIGTVFTVVDVHPANVNFGRILSDAVAERHVNIVCRTNFVFRVTNVVSTVRQFVAAYEKTGDSSHRVTVRTVPPLSYGVTSGKIRLFTDNAKYPQVDVSALAIVSSDIVVVPREILLGEAGRKPESITRSVAIRSRSKKTFNILKVELPQPDIAVSVCRLRGDVYRCDLGNIMPSPDIDGKNIVITTDHEDVRQIVIPIRVASKKRPLE